MTTIQHYRSTTAGHAPSSLLPGQIGINHTDGLFFYQNPAAAVAARSLRDYGFPIAKGDVSVAASLTLSIDPAVIGVMRGFILSLTSVQPASSSVIATLRMGPSSGINSGSSDYAMHNFSEDGTGFVYFYTQGANGFQFTGSLSSAFDAEIIIGTNDPASVALRRVQWNVAYRIAGGSIRAETGGGHRTADIDITQLQFLFSSGNITKAKYSLVGLP